MGLDNKMVFWYFDEGGTEDTAGDSATYPMSAFRGADPASATTTTMYFKPQVIGDAVATGDINDKVVVTHTGVATKVFMKALIQASNGSKDGFLVVADGDNEGVGADYGVTAWDATITYAG